MEVGKAGKHLGDEHPRVRRKIDPVPLKVTPGKPKTVKLPKLFGYTFRARPKLSPHKGGRLITCHTWYATERQRDDAMRAAGQRYRSHFDISDPKPITRGAQ